MPNNGLGLFQDLLRCTEPMADEAEGRRSTIDWAGVMQRKPVEVFTCLGMLGALS